MGIVVLNEGKRSFCGEIQALMLLIKIGLDKFIRSSFEIERSNREISLNRVFRSLQPLYLFPASYTLDSSLLAVKDPPCLGCLPFCEAERKDLYKK